jgi:uncharacterized membrane protein
MEWNHVIRWIHVMAASAWWGEVVVINFILIPSLVSREGEARYEFLNEVFPRVFRMASILSATTVVSGGVLLYRLIGLDLSLLTQSRWGWCLLVGGTLGLLLTLFHFFIEDHLAHKVGVGCRSTDTALLDGAVSKLKVVPRAGLVVITSIYGLMMFAVRGLWL